VLSSPPRTGARLLYSDGKANREDCAVLRSAGALVAGLVAWIVVVTALDRLLRLVVYDYALAEPTMTFTLSMLLARLAIAAMTSVAAGAVTGWIARPNLLAAWLLGMFLLALFIPQHVSAWHSFPVWYHLTFLVTLVPLVVFGAQNAPPPLEPVKKPAEKKPAAPASKASG
jgi:hypothetical protein